LYGHETYTVTLRKEYRFRMSEEKVFRRIFGPKKGESSGRPENAA
jgi:hypothetical protein